MLTQLVQCVLFRIRQMRADKITSFLLFKTSDCKTQNHWHLIRVEQEIYIQATFISNITKEYSYTQCRGIHNQLTSEALIC